MSQVEFTVNSELRTAQVLGSEPLLDTLRDTFGLMGTKEGCNEGECGACTVLLDGKPIDSCIYATGACEGHEITTIEGVAATDEMSALQRAFIKSGSIQCGFCTPGFVMTLTALLRENPAPTRTEVQNAISGNICRCTGYAQILEAVADVVSSSSIERGRAS